VGLFALLDPDSADQNQWGSMWIRIQNTDFHHVFFFVAFALTIGYKPQYLVDSMVNHHMVTA
jgi:hypothetical protein